MNALERPAGAGADRGGGWCNHGDLSHGGLTGGRQFHALTSQGVRASLGQRRST
jgi:hypothetical protein